MPLLPVLRPRLAAAAITGNEHVVTASLPQGPLGEVQ